jgi:hypothetical protein
MEEWVFTVAVLGDETVYKVGVIGGGEGAVNYAMRRSLWHRILTPPG